MFPLQDLENHFSDKKLAVQACTDHCRPQDNLAARVELLDLGLFVRPPVSLAGQQVLRHSRQLIPIRDGNEVR